VSYTIEELRTLSTDDLIAEHDRRTANVHWGVKDYLDELGRRDSKEVAEAIKENTDRVAFEVKTLYELTVAAGERMERLTRLIAMLTAISVAAGVAALVVALAA
jgi:hypothetical protein